MDKTIDHGQTINEFQITRDYSKINIGYFSADFRDHPVGHLIVKMIESHDKSKFNIYGFYLGININKMMNII